MWRGGDRWAKQGEWTELRFMSEAARRGFMVMKPWSRGSVYDVVVNRGSRLLGVQVKSTSMRSRAWVKTLVYVFSTNHREGKAYRTSDFDYYALYVIPRDIWYIIPHHDLGKQTHVEVRPDRSNHPYERYREAWHLLRQADKDRSHGISIQACAEESPDRCELDVSAPEGHGRLPLIQTPRDAAHQHR